MQLADKETLSLILLNIPLETIEILSKTSKDIRATTTALRQSNYFWKLMVENLIDAEVPADDVIDYRECYHTIKDIGKGYHIMFTRDVSYAKIGLLMDYGLGSSISEAIQNASVDTIEFLMSCDNIPSHIWENIVITLEIALMRLRTDVSLLFIQDGRCFNNDIGLVSQSLTKAAERGLSTVFFYLIEAYPEARFIERRATINRICCAGARDILDYLVSCGLIKGSMTEGFAILDFIDGEQLRISSNKIMLGLFENGYVSQAIEVFNRIDGIDRPHIAILDAISHGIQTGKIATLDKLHMLIDRHVLDINRVIIYCVNTLRVDLVDNANYLALTLLKTTNLRASDNKEFTKAIEKFAKSPREVGKTKLAKDFLNCMWFPVPQWWQK